MTGQKQRRLRLEEVTQAAYWLSEEVSHSLIILVLFRYFKVLANGSYLAYYTEMPHTTPVNLSTLCLIVIEKRIS
jgi:hypothetical protein